MLRAGLLQARTIFETPLLAAVQAQHRCVDYMISSIDAAACRLVALQACVTSIWRLVACAVGPGLQTSSCGTLQAVPLRSFSFLICTTPINLDKKGGLLNHRHIHSRNAFLRMLTHVRALCLCVAVLQGHVRHAVWHHKGRGAAQCC